MIDGARELIEDFALGALCTATWIQDHGKGWVTFGLAVVYGVYKIISQRLDKEGKRLDNELKRKQLEQWNQTRVSIESNIADQLQTLQESQIK